MKANTLQCRKAINAAIKRLYATKLGTWTDPVDWSDYGPRERIVAYSVTDAHAVAKLANQLLRNELFDNEVRVTDCNDSGYSGGPYVRVNADLPA